MWNSSWQKRYAQKLIFTDTFIIIFCVFLAQAISFDFTSKELDVHQGEVSDLRLQYSLLSLALIISWLGLLSLLDSRDSKVIGFGPEEFRQVFYATLAPFAFFAILAFATRMSFGRSYLFISLPLGMILLLASRYLWRKRLHRKRAKGKNSHATLIVGDHEKIGHVAQQLVSRPYLGFNLLGAVTDQPSQGKVALNVSVLGNLSSLLSVVDRMNVRILVLTDTDAFTPQRLRELGWELESRGVVLVVATALTDIAGPRLHTRPVAGLPLTFVDYPEFTRAKRFSKRIFDIIMSLFIVVIISPLLFALALVVKSGSTGPVIFKQQRVGRHGQKFNMLKFRSMVVDAEKQLDHLKQHLTEEQATGPNTVLFKMKDDPRITKTGRFMRKYSLDELPQLFNVLKGDMSLVGPRPPLESEVEQYGIWDHRRLLVRPGITGLWQTSGRSNLSWEESIRLDLYYVENWSFTGDLILLAKTFRTVLKPDGAY